MLTLRELTINNNGYLIFSLANLYGYSRQAASYYAKTHNMKRIAHGIYVDNEAWVDDLFVIFLKNKEVVFSHETALYLHGLMEREPLFTSLTVKYGYNATHLRKKGYIVHTTIIDFIDLGLISIKTPMGNVVNAYDMERTICDIVRNKDNMDIQVFNYALKEYMKSKSKRIPVLLEYAKKLRVLKQIRTYLEVLL